MQNRKVVALLVVSVLLASFLTYALASSPSTTFTISSGVYPGAISYTVYSVGTNYFAKNQNGRIDYSDTDAGSIINDAISSLSDGGYIAFGLGNFYCGETIELVTGRTVTLKGLGSQNTALIADAGVTPLINCDSIGTSEGGGLYLTDLLLSGDSQTGTGLYLNHTFHRIEVRNCWVTNFDIGVQNLACWGVSFYNTIIYYCGTGLVVEAAGLPLQAGFVNYYGGEIRGCGDNGIYIDDGQNCNFWGTEIEADSGNAIYIRNSGDPIAPCYSFEGCYITGESATYTADAIINILSNETTTRYVNALFQNCILDVATENHLFSLYYVEGLVISSCSMGTLTGAYDWVHIGASSQFDIQNPQYFSTGTHVYLHASGTANVNNLDAIAHGMGVTPDVITFGINDNSATLGIADRNATHFVVSNDQGWAVRFDWKADILGTSSVP